MITLRSCRPTDVARCTDVTRNIIHLTTSMSNSNLQAPARPLPSFVTHSCYKRRKAHVWRLNDEDPESVRQPSLSRILPSSSFSGKAPLSNFGSAGTDKKKSTLSVLRMILRRPSGSVLSLLNTGAFRLLRRRGGQILAPLTCSFYVSATQRVRSLLSLAVTFQPPAHGIADSANLSDATLQDQHIQRSCRCICSRYRTYFAHSDASCGSMACTSTVEVPSRIKYPARCTRRSCQGYGGGSFGQS